MLFSEDAFPGTLEVVGLFESDRGVLFDDEVCRYFDDDEDDLLIFSKPPILVDGDDTRDDIIVDFNTGLLRTIVKLLDVFEEVLQTNVDLKPLLLLNFADIFGGCCLLIELDDDVATICCWLLYIVDDLLLLLLLPRDMMLKSGPLELRSNVR